LLRLRGDARLDAPLPPRLGFSMLRVNTL